MSLPTIEPLPEDPASLPPARRRRQRRNIIPPDSSERAKFLHDLSLRTIPSFDFFIFSLIAGLVLIAGLLLDAPALFLLAALFAPFMAPVIGLALGSITGAVRFILQALGSLSIGSVILFLSGAMAGWAVALLPEQTYQQTAFHAHFTWADFILLVVGAGLTTYRVVRSPNQKPLVTSVALAYEIYLPAGIAGFGLTSGIPGLWPNCLTLYFIHLIWAVLTGALVLSFFGLRPLNRAGYGIGAGYIAVAFVLTISFYNPRYALPAIFWTAGDLSAPTDLPVNASEPTVSAVALPTRTATPVPSPVLAEPSLTPTPSLQPSATNTPAPTSFPAEISAPSGNGAVIRENPSYDAAVIQTLLNGTPVEVLSTQVDSTGTIWANIRFLTDREGWIVQSLLHVNSPAP